GILYHRILERIYTRIIDRSIPWPDCDQPTLRAALAREVDAATHELHAELSQQTPGYEKLRARLKRTLAILLEADRRRACHGALRPAAVELTFGRAGPPTAYQPDPPPPTHAPPQ